MGFSPTLDSASFPPPGPANGVAGHQTFRPGGIRGLGQGVRDPVVDALGDSDCALAVVDRFVYVLFHLLRASAYSLLQVLDLREFRGDLAVKPLLVETYGEALFLKAFEDLIVD